MHRRCTGCVERRLHGGETIDAARGQQQAGALSGKGFCAGCADSGAGAGDEDDAILQRILSHALYRIRDDAVEQPRRERGL
jgi:hypothetical protein